MRFLRARLLYLIILPLVSLFIHSDAKAQLNFQCSQIITWVPDTARIVSFKGLPGDTIELPLFWKTDSVVLGLSANIRYPSDVLEPVLAEVDTTIDTVVNNQTIPPDTAIDTSIVEYLAIREYGRALFLDTVQDHLGFDSIVVRDLFRSSSVKIRDSAIVKVQWIPRIPQIGVPLDSLPPGRGEIARIKFRVKPGFPINTTRSVTLAHLPVYGEGFPPSDTNCAPTESAQLWNVQFGDTVNQIQRSTFPVLRPGNFVVDTVDPQCVNASQCPIVPNFTAVCNNGQCEYIPDQDPPECTGAGAGNCPPLSGFTVQCINSQCVYTPISTHAPVVQPITPNVITITQGDMATFNVSATDDNPAHTITLTATGLPPGATFSSIPSTSPVTGTFNWIPSLSQSGSFVISITARDNLNNTSQAQTVSIIVEELQFDQLYSTSAEELDPVGGIPGFKFPVLFPIDLLSRQPAVYGVQFDLQYPHRQITIDSIITTDRTPTFVVDWLEMNDSSIRVVTLGLDNEEVLAGSSSAVLQIAVTIDSLATPGVYDMLMSRGRESIDPDPTVGSVELQTLPGIIEVDQLGDVNTDRIVDVADMVSVVAYIIGNFGLPQRNFAAADVIVNDSVNVLDLVGINNIIFELPIQQPAPVIGPGGPPLATVALDLHQVNPGEYGQMAVHGDFPEKVAGVEFTLKYNPSTVSMLPPEKTDASSRYQVRYKDNKSGAMRVLLYTTSPQTSTMIQEGISEFLKLPLIANLNIQPGDVQISDIVLANPNAGRIETEYNPDDDDAKPTTFKLGQNYPNPFNPETRIDYSIDKADDGSVAQHVVLNVYNILGQRVITLVDEEKQPGDYTVTWSGVNESGNRVASGVYLYRLQVSSSKADTKKMILLK